MDVTSECEEVYPEIGTQISEQVAVLQEAHSPEIKIGEHCHMPYECDFIGHCWKHIPKDSVFNLPSLSFDEKFQIYKKQGANVSKTLNHEELSAITKAQLKSIMNKESFVNEEALRALSYENIAFVKVLTFRPAIPIINNTMPYQSLAYGFVIMSWDKKENPLEIKTFLSRNIQQMEKEVFERLSVMTKDYSKLFTFQEDTNHEFFNKNERLHNLYNLFSQGDIIHPEINNYRFITIYKALTGKLPWFNKVLIDQQAALIYEKNLRNNFEDEEAMQQIETYAKEWIKYLNRLYSTITNLPFFYLVFDYKSSGGNGHTLIPVVTMASVKENPTSIEEENDLKLAKQRLIDLRISVKTTIEHVMMMEGEDFPTVPTYDNCRYCPLNHLNNPKGVCKEANFVKRI